MANELSLTPASGHVDGAAYYMQFVQEGTNLIFDGSSVAAAPDYGDTDVALTEINGMGIWSGSVPSDLPLGSYRVVFRRQAGASPAATDDVAGTPVRIQKTGGSRILLMD